MAALTLVSLLVAAVGGMAALGVGPFGDEAPATTPPMPADRDSASGDGPGAGHVRPFSIDVQRIEPCGRTCRDVTVTLTNNGGNPRENITVATTISAGGDAVWTGEDAVGTLGSHESTTRTRRVDVGFVGGAKVRQNGGTATIETVVRWDGGSATYREQRQVA